MTFIQIIEEKDTYWNIFRGRSMAKITVGTEKQEPIEIYYEDHGTGKPVVLIHGWC